MKHTLLLLAIVLLCGTAHAQDDAPILPLAVSVTANGAACSQYTVTLFKDNVLVADLPPSKRGAFELALDLNARFTVRIGKEGYRLKNIAVDTAVPEGTPQQEAVVYTVDLEPMDQFAHADPFYLDFPSAIVQWDNTAGEFTHSDRYLADIQLKMALLTTQAATE